ncbi:hypothetical protein [Puerhibacterium sp. TATVAM-FAB25]
MGAKRSAAARRRELWWFLGTVAAILVLAPAAVMAVPFLSALAAGL